MKPLLAILLLSLTACGMSPPNWGGSYEPLMGFDGKPLINSRTGQPWMVSVGAPSDSRVGMAIARRQAQAEASRSAAEFRYYRGRILRELR